MALFKQAAPSSTNGHGRPPEVQRLVENANLARDEVRAFHARAERFTQRRLELVIARPTMLETYSARLVALSAAGEITAAMRSALKDEIGLAKLELELEDLDLILRGHAQAVAMLEAKAMAAERKAKIAGLAWVSKKYFGRNSPVEKTRRILEEHVAPLLDEALHFYQEAQYFLAMSPSPGSPLGLIVPPRENPPVSVSTLLLQAAVPWSEPPEPASEDAR